MFRVCKSHSDQSRCVADLAEACLSLKKQLGYSDQDARIVALENIFGVALAGQMILNLLGSWTIGDKTVRQEISQLLGLQTITQEGLKYAGDSLNISSRLGFVILTQFQIENALRNIGRELHVHTGTTGFFRMAKSVLDALSLPTDRMDILNTPARIRNSLHANGIHHKVHPTEKAIVMVGGVQYEFRDGERVACASWEHLAHALECSVKVLGEIFQTPQVATIPDPMMDQYAWDILTSP